MKMKSENRNQKQSTDINRLSQSFYARDTHAVAKDLLGKILVRRWRNTLLMARITELESYVGENDAACHASKGLTPRTAVMFGEAGRAYVYLIYGMYHCLNIVTEAKGFPAAVLIRGAQPICNVTLATHGPGRLTRALHITRALNGEDLTSSAKLWAADDGFKVSAKNILTSPRIGVDYAGADALLPWRYCIKHGL